MSSGSLRGELAVEGLGVHFGGVRALHDVTFRTGPGRIIGIMGPNGAGKTTLFNLVTGVYRPTAGRISFGGRQLELANPALACRAGIARTFQSGRPFARMTALENVLVGLHYGAPQGRPKGSDVRRRAAEVLELVGLARRADRPISSLNLMERKLVELARALATRPGILLLDEPLAGLNPLDLDAAIRVVRRVRDEAGITVLWIEHIMKVLMETCEHLIVLDHGEKLAEGTPAEIAANATVAQAYFGRKASVHG